MADNAAPDHDCNIFSATDFETGEQVCVKCGMVTAEPDRPDPYVSDAAARSMNSNDHHSGNALLNSETEQMDYSSPTNPGLAYMINGGGRDYLGKKVKTTLHNSYRSGCIAGGKEVILKEDPITKEVSFKFDSYDKPFLRMAKERALSELSRYGLDTVELTIVAKALKTITSRLVFSEILDYAWRAAVLNAGVLKPKDALLIEQELYALMEPIRIKLLSRCDKELAEELTAPPTPEAIEAK